MKRLSAAHVARNFSAVLDALEQDALSVFADLYRTLDDQTADASLSASVAAQRKSRRGRLAELRNPWAG